MVKGKVLEELAMPERVFVFFTLFAACVAGPGAAQVDIGRDLFVANCAACHGVTATGDGPAASGIEGGVPDLTMIAQRNDGVFPLVDTMSFIDGYTRGSSYSPAMPKFSETLFASPMVLYDTGDGIPTPTPSALVALAEYLQSIQR